MKRLVPLLSAATVLAVSYSGGALAAYTYGSVRLVINTFVVSTIPTGDEVACQVTVTATDALGTNVETAFAVATQIGTSPVEYECVFTIPWLWDLANAGATPVSINYGAGFIPSGSTNSNGLVRSTDHQGAPVTENLVTTPNIQETVFARL